MSSASRRTGRHGKPSAAWRTISLLLVIVLAGGGSLFAIYLGLQRQIPTISPMAEGLSSSAASGGASPSSASTTVSVSTGSSSPAKTTTPPSSTLLAKTADAGDAYTQKILFLGDSRINGMLYSRQISSANTFAENGLSHSVALNKAIIDLGTGKLLTIPQAVGIRKPDIMLVAFGINGVAYMGKTGFMKSYEEFIDALLAQSPDSRLIIQSILPVSKAYAQKDPRMANDTIDWYNQQLLKLAEEKNLYYLDTAQALKGADNNLDPRFDKGDGLHFNAAAGEAILTYIRTHALPDWE